RRPVQYAQPGFLGPILGPFPIRREVHQIPHQPVPIPLCQLVEQRKVAPPQSTRDSFGFGLGWLADRHGVSGHTPEYTDQARLIIQSSDVFSFLTALKLLPNKIEAHLCFRSSASSPCYPCACTHRPTPAASGDAP